MPSVAEQPTSTAGGRSPLPAISNAAELKQHPSRPAEYERENRSLAGLIQEMARPFWKRPAETR